MVVAYVFNPSTWEAEAGESLSSRPAWSTQWVPGEPGLHKETQSQKAKQNNKEIIYWPHDFRGLESLMVNKGMVEKAESSHLVLTSSSTIEAAGERWEWHEAFETLKPTLSTHPFQNSHTS